MDRDTTIIMAATIIFLTLVGSFFIQPSASRSGLEARAAAAGAPAGEVIPPSAEVSAPSKKFNPEDIRYKFQQAEAKKGKTRKFMKAAPESPPSDDMGSENEEPTAEEAVADESAEEPEINE
jgi:hypothetical protein